MTKQRGSILIESIVIVTIVAILAVIAVPNISDLLIRKDVETARDKLVQVIKLARQQAQSENTIVTVTISGRTITLVSQNNANGNRTITLPDRIQLVNLNNNNSLTLTFSAVGEFSGLNNADQDRTIVIRPTRQTNDNIEARVRINTIGNIAGI